MLTYQTRDFRDIVEISSLTTGDVRELSSPDRRTCRFTGIIQPNPDYKRMDDQVSLVTGLFIQLKGLRLESDGLNPIMRVRGVDVCLYQRLGNVSLRASRLNPI